VAAKIVIIGSGIGGSASAVLSAHAGFDVTVLEKNRRLGGSCASYEKQGFTIDIGTHMFTRGPKGPLGEVLARVGRRDTISFRKTTNIAEIRTIARNQKDIVKISVPVARHRYPRFFVELAHAMNLGPRQMSKAMRMFGHIIFMSDAEVDEWNDATVEDFIMKHTDHPGLISLFGFLLGLYFILPYWEVSAGEAFWAFRRMVKDNWLSYPLGGARAIPETYCQIAESFGAEVRTGVGVKRIRVSLENGKRRVLGVTLSDGTQIDADIVISTSSVKTTVEHLVGPEFFPESYVARAKKIKGSQIAVQAKIALKKKLVSAGALVGGVGTDFNLFSVQTEDLRSMFNSVRSGRIPSVVPFYCPVPSNFDPTLAPPGCQLLTVCAVAPTTDVTLQDPSSAWEESMLEAMRAIVPNLDENILFIDRFSVKFIEHWIGKKFGPAVSTAQTPSQVGDKRPKIQTPIAGLYIAGCGAGARGVGTELAAASAMECVDMIVEEWRNKERPRPEAHAM
jgi:prolycopene isomerase